MNKGFLVLAFSIGAAVGSVVTWGVLRKRFERIAQEEIDSVKEMYAAKYDSKDESEDESTEEKTEEPVDPTISSNYRDLANKYNTESESDRVTKDEDEDGDDIHVIPPEEFDTLFDYDAVQCTYWADGILSNDYDDKPMNDISSTVGHESLKHFGEYEDDVVHVRNDELRTDYEITLEHRRYVDVIVPYGRAES